MIRINVNLVTATVQETEVLTSGRVGLQCEFTFSSEWDGLIKTATFEGAESADVAMLTGNVVTVPRECMSSPGAKLRVGVCGMNEAGDIVIPTVWANAGRIQQGAEPSGIPAEEPSPNWAAQVQAAAASALEIARGVKNEADSGGFDGADGVSPTAVVSKTGTVTTVTITDANGTTTASINDGTQGVQGESGPAGSSTWVADTEPYLIAVGEHGITNAFFIVSELKGKTGETVKAGDTVTHAGYMDNGEFHSEYNGIYYVTRINTYDNDTVAECDYKGQIIGPKGDTGDTGTAATVAVGTTTTLAPGSYATVTNTGTSSAAVLNFGIPKGEKGDPGNPTDAQVTEAVDDWLDDNVAQETGYVLDRTLSMQNAAAPADLLGEMGMSDDIKEALLAHFRNTPTLTSDDTYSALENALYNNFWQVTNTLSGCTSSNVAKSVKKGVSYSATITAATGYTMTGATISVTMGGEDITATAYNNGTITIAEVTGALEIEISAVYNLWAIVNDLTGCDTSNDAETITKGSAYTATISATSGYTMTGATVSITMGGVDITATAYSSGTITISAVTGTVIITITASVSGATLVSISAVYTQSGTVYDTDSLDSLKNDLVVTAAYSDSSTAAVLPEDYTLSGTLAAGNCTITVTYQSMTDTFITIVTKYWTKEWTWEDGLPGDNGFTKTASGTSSETIRDDIECISIYVKGTSAGIGYAYANTYDVGVIEAKIRLNSGQLGARLSYGDGSNAVSIRIQYSSNYKGIYLEDTASLGTKLMTTELGVDYTVRIERNGTTGKVFVNGVCLDDDTGLALASLGRTETRLLIFGASSSAAYARLMSLKVKDGGV